MQVIAPSVVGTVESLFKVSTGLFLESRATMAADIVETIDLSCFIADEDQAFIINIVQKEITGVGYG